MAKAKIRAQKSRTGSPIREALLKSEADLLDEDIEDGAEEAEPSHGEGEPGGDAFEDDDEDDSQPPTDDAEPVHDADTDEDPENGDLDAPEDGGDDDEDMEDLEERRGDVEDDHEEPKQGPDEDEDDATKSRRLIFSMKKSLAHLASMHKGNPQVRKDALLGKALGGGRLTEAECNELDRMNRGLPPGPSLRHKVNKGARVTPALQKAHAASEGFRALAANLVKSQGALADEVEATRENAMSQNLALAKGIQALGELSVRTAERQDKQ